MPQHARSQFVAWPYLLALEHVRGPRHVSDTSMSIEDMALYQKRTAEGDIRELIAQRRDRYCFAHELIKPHAALPDRLFDRAMLDIGPFLLPWSELISAWRRQFFDPQMCLLEDQRIRELRRRRVFVEDEVFARFTRDPDWVRCVLETANLIPLRRSDYELSVGDLLGDIIQDVKERSDNDDHQQD